MATIEKPIRPGTVIDFVTESVPRVAPSFAEVVAVPIIHDWGPLTSIELSTSYAEWAATFGDGDTEGRTAVLGAFAGQGIPGQGGAGGVIAYRMGVSGTAAKATKTIQNTTPANALTLTAKYEGTRGNELTYSSENDPRDSANNILNIFHSGARVESFSYPDTDITNLVAQINLRSNWITATMLITGVALAVPGTQVAFTGGNNGSTLTSTEWLGALDALEFGAFSLLAPYNLTDSGILASLLGWVQDQEAANRPVMAVIGGGSSDDISDAIDRSADMNDPHVVNIGVGTYDDSLVDKTLTTAQIAPRIAGILAARGEEKAATFAKIADLTPSDAGDNPVHDEIELAILNGVTVLSRSESADADLKIEMALTTYTTTTDDSRDQEIFRDARLVRVLDIFIRNIKLWGDENIIGGTTVTQDTRDAVRVEGSKRISDLEERGLIIAGTGFINAEDPGDPVLADSVPFDFGWVFARTTNYIFGNGKIR